MAKGTIEARPRKDGTKTWRLTVSVGKGRDGRYKRLRETFVGPKRQAERRLRQLLDEVESGHHRETTVRTVGDLIEAWLEAVQNAVRESTFESYKVYLTRYWRPRIGNIQLRRLSPEDIQAGLGDLLSKGGKSGGGLSRRTGHHAYRILSECLAHGVRLGVLVRNPAQAVTPPRPSRQEVRTVSETAAGRIFEHIRQHSPWAYHPTAIALLTGCRRGEILGLKWNDVFLTGERPALTIKRAVSALNGGEVAINEPKTSRAARLVDISPMAVQVLEDRLQLQKQEAQIIGRTIRDEDFVFSNALGEVFRPKSLSQAFMRAAKATGAGRVSFHSLRHTHATELFRAGVHPKVASDRLGHSSIAITIDTYSHAVAGLGQAAASAFDARFARALDGSGPVGQDNDLPQDFGSGEGETPVSPQPADHLPHDLPQEGAQRRNKAPQKADL